MTLVPVGVIHGRFQPLHLGHLEYLLAGKSRCQKLVIGITNPDPSLTSEHTANPLRSLPHSNPFTYYERLQMISASLLEAGVKRDEFEIVPFPINYPHFISSYVPMHARFFMTIYDDWGRAKLEILRSLGVETEVMWEGSLSERLTSTEIRLRIANGDQWQNLVPPAVARIITLQGLDKRIRTSQDFSAT